MLKGKRKNDPALITQVKRAWEKGELPEEIRAKDLLYVDFVNYKTGKEYSIHSIKNSLSSHAIGNKSSNVKILRKIKIGKKIVFYSFY